MDERDVVVTGLGAVTPLGRDVPSLWEALTAGRSGVGAITSFDASGHACRVAGEIHDYDPHPVLDPDHAARLDRSALFAVDAAAQALEDAALPLTPENAVHVGVVIGVVRPGEQTVWEGHHAFHNEGPASMQPGYIGRTLAHAPAAAVAAALGARGPLLGIGTAAASGASALHTAAAMIRSGEVEVALAGGCDAPITPPAIAAFSAMGILTGRTDDPARAVRPFDADADGFALSEGACVLVLESAELAQQRGARVYGTLAGSSAITEPGAYLPSPREAGRALKGALHRPALMQGEIDYFCANGTGTPPLDRMETDAVKLIFGEVTASKLTLSAPKSMLGHLGGAAGAADAIVCLKAIETGTVPPTINLEQPAEGCDLDYTPGTARPLTVRNAMSYAYGFGGQHVALCFSAP